MNWKPKKDTVGVPGKGYIQAADFSEEDLQALIKRAKNRKIDVHTFLMNCDLVPTQPQLTLDEDLTDPLQDLKDKYKELSGKEADKRWKESKLQEQIELLEVK